MNENKDKKEIPISVNFLFGGISGMAATLIVQPMDLVKNRMQLSGEGGKSLPFKSSFECLSFILKREGVIGLYTGLSAGLLRQATYSTVRLGVYVMLLNYFSKENTENNKGEGRPNFLTKLLIGSFSGGVASFFGAPTEIALIRMTAEGQQQIYDKRSYKNVFHALYRIAKDEGVLTLWRGCGPIMAIVINATQLSTYSHCKTFLLSINTGPGIGIGSSSSGINFIDKWKNSINFRKDNVTCHLISSMISGFFTCLASLPIDTVKTRIQNMKNKTISGVPEYNGIFDCFYKIITKEGVSSLWKGFTPYYARLGPHTILTFIFLEQLNKYYKISILDDASAHGGL